jgi:hypothetical protein
MTVSQKEAVRAGVSNTIQLISTGATVGAGTVSLTITVSLTGGWVTTTVCTTGGCGVAAGAAGAQAPKIIAATIKRAKIFCFIVFLSFLVINRRIWGGQTKRDFAIISV